LAFSKVISGSSSEGGQVFMAHDAEGYKQHKHSPEFYE
jgi:hypothetical protein